MEYDAIDKIVELNDIDDKLNQEIYESFLTLEEITYNINKLNKLNEKIIKLGDMNEIKNINKNDEKTLINKENNDSNVNDEVNVNGKEKANDIEKANNIENINNNVKNMLVELFITKMIGIRDNIISMFKVIGSLIK